MKIWMGISPNSKSQFPARRFPKRSPADMIRTTTKKPNSFSKQRKTLNYSGPSPTVLNRFDFNKQRKMKS
jgi:hypothetical protein